MEHKKSDEAEKDYEVCITERLQKIVTVKATSVREAEQIAEQLWNDSEWVLGADDFVDAEFHAI